MTMSEMKFERIYCALDTADLNQAKQWAKIIGPITGGLKVGMEFVNTFGPQGIEAVLNACPDARLFIDLKFHDIPNTVAKAIKTTSERFHPAYINVHAAGGRIMMQDAQAACAHDTKLLAVTVLTSMNDALLASVGQQTPVDAQVCRLALLTRDAGLDGVVCSAHEIASIRKLCGPDFVLMVPGIRPAGEDTQDQERVMTPKEALNEGATHLVIGRPITQSPDPAQAAADILSSLRGTQ